MHVVAYYLEMNVIVSDEIPRDAIQVKRHTYLNPHNRTIALTCTDVEKDYLYTRSSYICMTKDTRTFVGRILSIFHHAYQLRPTTFAYVCWFDGPHLDISSQLHYVFTHSESLSVVPLQSISSPLVTAQDDEDPATLWILNLICNSYTHHRIVPHIV